VSSGGQARFTVRNLYYELVRRGDLPPPGAKPRRERMAFRAALRPHASLPSLVGLISLSEARSALPPRAPPDLFDYSVRRVLVFDRSETFLLFAHNGFHRKLEVALLGFPWFPQHVAERLAHQLRTGLRTALYTVHDASPRGVRLPRDVRAAFSKYGEPRVADVGLTFAQAFRAGVPVRQRTLARQPDTPAGGDPEEALFHANGSYAHLEEMRPFDLLRWTYDRVSHGVEELGFG
jgi:hypothetical protein